MEKFESLNKKLHGNKTIYGTCIVSPSAIWPKAVKGAGLDFVFIDTEHIPLNRAQLTTMCQTYAALNLSPIVRIPSPDPYLACMAKDAGAIGVLAPYIENTEEVKQLVGATKLRPLKGFRLQNVLSGKEVLTPELEAYLSAYNQDSLCLINIESSAALNNIDSLLTVKGLDAVIIGPHDLSINLGLPEQYDHPVFEAAVQNIIKKARNKQIAAGIHFPKHPDQQIKWVKEGANIVLHSSDLFLFAEKLKADLKQIKQASGDTLNFMEDSGPNI